MIYFQDDFKGSPPNRLMITSLTGIDTVPKLILIINVIISIKINTKK